MTVPPWIPGILAAVMLLVAVVSIAALAASPRAAGADADGAHVLMGVAMAGMLEPGLAVLPGRAWAGAFGVLTAWFAWRVGRDARGRGARGVTGSQHAPHLVHSAAMVYMLVAPVAPGAASGPGMAMGGPGGGMAHLPTLSLIFALLLSGCAIRDLDRLAAAGTPGAGRTTAPHPATAPGHPATAPGHPGPAAPHPGPAASHLSPAAAHPGLAASHPGPARIADRVLAAAAARLPAAGRTAAPRGPEPAQAIEPAAVPGPVFRPRSAPCLRVAAGCRIAMGVTMVFMLIVMS